MLPHYILRAVFGAVVLIMWGLAAATTEQGATTRSATLQNAYCRLDAADGAIESLRLDPSGKGKHAPNRIARLGFENVVARGGVSVSRDKATSATWTGLSAGLPVSVGIQKTELAAELLPGHTLAQPFDAPLDFDRVTVRVPTWYTTGSQFTLTLSRPDNGTVASKRFEDVQDNAELSMTFPYQPAGRYTVTMSAPGAEGRIGWWGGKAASSHLADALADDRAVSGTQRHLTVHCTEWYGAATVTIALDGSRIDYGLAIVPHDGKTAAKHVMRLAVPWTEEGYDTSAAATPFKRFFSDAHRLFPIEQLKRKSFVDIVLTSRKWFHIDGTAESDLTFHCGRGTLGWERTPGHLTTLLDFASAGGEDGRQDYRMAVRVEPRRDEFPADWPAFRTSDPQLDRDLNLFHYERNLSYPSPCYWAEWLEWSALGRAWFPGPHKDAEKRRVTDTYMDKEGYVHVSNVWRGWPFPEPERYDTRHFSTNARYILGFWRTFLWDRDAEFLRGEIGDLRKAMEYQLGRLKGADGLIVTDSKDITGRHRSIGSNYWDISPFGHLDAYGNTAFHASLEAMAQLEEMYAELPARDGNTSGMPPARTPAEYRRMAELCRGKYTSTFWDEKEGRFAGCVDVDGQRHDYGFTFVNLEAMFYGLASPTQATRIYDWLDHGKSSTGRNDIYSAWVFAPRATTIHNPMWDEQHPDGKEGGEVKPWWSWPWQGTPFGEQCQDGGAILYTSFFDLMARIRFLGPDDAMKRWNEILARYRMPDRLCGGPPLSRGENPQQLNPGSVGLDIPFPESGMVPLWFLYGVMGVEPVKEGLRIAPRLPKQLEFCEATNIGYRFLPLTVRVTRRDVRIRCEREGYEFDKTYPLGPDGSVLFDRLPGKLGAFPSRPVGPRPPDAAWVWAEEEREQQTIMLRRGFTLPARPGKASLVVATDDRCEVFVNGRSAGRHASWQEAATIDVTHLLKKGGNVLAVRASNRGGPAGLILELTAEGRGWSERVATDGSWKCALEAEGNWASPDFDDGAWQPCCEIGRPPVQPWGEIQAE